MQRKNCGWREMFCTIILEGDNGGEEEFPPADMRGVPQPPLTAKVMLIKIMPFFCISLLFSFKDWMWKIITKHPYHHIIVGWMPMLPHVMLIDIVAQDYVIILFMLGLWAYSIHLILRWECTFLRKYARIYSVGAIWHNRMANPGWDAKAYSCPLWMSSFLDFWH